MAQRTVAVRLQAEVGSYVAGLSKASAATMRLGESASATGKKSKDGFDLAGKGALLMGGLAVAGLGMAVSASMKFEQSMSGVQAATHASAATMDDLRAAAMQAGADTAYSATEAADAITEMSKAGVSAKDIMGGGLKGALSLAAAGQLDVADAAGIASIAMQQFNLSGEDLPHVADLLAAGAGKAMGSVDDLGMALGQAGLVASAAGLSIEETTGGLAAFANAGLIGSDAGTSFRSMIMMLQGPTAKSSELMASLGLNMYDANGKMLGLSEMAGQMQGAFAGMTDEQRNSAMATIFGSDAVRAANVLYKEGAAGIADWTAKVNDSGYAAETAAALQDNLKGDLEKLSGSWETLMINLGSGAQGPLREVVQMLTGVMNAASGLVDVIGAVPAPVLIAAGALGAVAALKGPVSSVFETMALKAMYAVEAMTGPNSIKTAAGGLASFFGGPWGLAIAGATVGVSLLTTMLSNSKEATDAAKGAQHTFAEALRESKGALDENVRAAAAKAAQDADMLGMARNAGIDLSLVTDAVLGNKDAYEQVTASMNAYVQSRLDAARGNTEDASFVAAMNQANDFAAALGILAPTVAQTAADQKDLADATATTADATADAAQQTVTQAAEAQKALDDWLKSLQQVGTAFVDPLSTYKGLLDEKTQAEKDQAQATADATADSKDSWKDYVSDVSVSLDEYATKLEEQITAQENWRANIAAVTQRGGLEVGQILAAMGVEGAGLTEQMANATGEDFARMRDDLIRDAQLGGAGAAAELDQAMKVMAEIGAQGGSATALAVAQKLGLGLADVRGIAAQYGVELATGLDPLLTALGSRTVALQARGEGMRNANGNLYEEHQAEIAPGGAWRIWAEPETGGEAYIPLAPGKRDRSMNIWRETGKRLGAPEAEYFAAGGFSSAADVPKPRSTAPYGPPISTAGNSTMQTGYDETVAWMKANAAMAGAGPLGGDWQSIATIVQAAIPQARINSTFRPGDPGYHGKGKAVDFGFGSGAGGAGSAGLASIARFLYSGYGRSLAELIYDGIGDNTPDVKNSADHVYNRQTQLEHANHVHAAVYHEGTDFVPQTGWAYLEKGEAVIPASANAQSREFSGSYGPGGSSGPVSVNITGAEIVGTLDLGDGIRGVVRGEIVSAFTGATNRGAYNG